MASYPAAAIKHPDKNNLREKWFVLTHSSNSDHGGEVKLVELMAATARKQRATKKYAQLAFSTLNSSGDGPIHN